MVGGRRVVVVQPQRARRKGTSPPVCTSSALRREVGGSSWWRLPFYYGRHSSGGGASDPRSSIGRKYVLGSPRRKAKPRRSGTLVLSACGSRRNTRKSCLWIFRGLRAAMKRAQWMQRRRKLGRSRGVADGCANIPCYPFGTISPSAATLLLAHDYHCFPTDNLATSLL